MSWFRVDDSMLNHPKWRRAIKAGGDAVVHLWLALGTWCSTHLTDGLVPADMLSEIPGPRGKRTRERALQALADQNLLVRHVDGSVLLHDYLDYNPSRADVMAERERWAKSKRSQRVSADVHIGRSRESTRSPDVPSRPPPVPGLTLTGVEPELTDPGTYLRIPEAWKVSEAFYGEAVMAGVTRAGLDEAVAYWRGRKLGGEWFTIEDFFRGKLASIRQREEKSRYLQHITGKAPIESWEPEPKALVYKSRYGIDDASWSRMVREQRAEDAAGERSMRERHRIFGQRLAKFCRERDRETNIFKTRAARDAFEMPGRERRAT